jgi:hypothetical protein
MRRVRLQRFGLATSGGVSAPGPQSNATLSNVEGDGSASPPHDNAVPGEGEQSLNYGNMSLRDLRWHARRLHGPNFYELLDSRGNRRTALRNLLEAGGGS